MIGVNFESLENVYIPPPPSDEMSGDNFMAFSASPTAIPERTEEKEASLDAAIALFIRCTKTTYNKNQKLIMKN